MNADRRCCTACIRTSTYVSQSEAAHEAGTHKISRQMCPLVSRTAKRQRVNRIVICEQVQHRAAITRPDRADKVITMIHRGLTDMLMHWRRHV